MSGSNKIFFDAATQPSMGTPGPGHQTPLSPNKTRFQPLIDLFCCLDFVSKFDSPDKFIRMSSCEAATLILLLMILDWSLIDLAAA